MRLIAGFLIAFTLGWSSWAAAFERRPDIDAFINEMVARHGFDRVELEQLFAGAQSQPNILSAIARPAEKVKPWKDYRRIFLDEARIAAGVEFWQAHQATLERAERTYGVPARIIVAILGVETRYGTHQGTYRVLDALSTLAFDYPPRAPFFRKELENFLLLARDEGMSPTEALGSYAGAMGYGQFMPSSFRSFAVDFDGDGHKDIWTNVDDAIGSVANYFNAHKWAPGEPVVMPASSAAAVDPAVFNHKQADISVAQLRALGVVPFESLSPAVPAIALKLEGDSGDEYWIGLHNFSVIMRYNKSHLYAMAVNQLGEQVARRLQ